VFDRELTLRIRKKLVAIISVLLVLTLVTTISFSASYEVYATGEDGAVQEEQAEGGDEAAAEEGTQENKEKKKNKKKNKNKNKKETEETAEGDAAGGDDAAAADGEGTAEGNDDISKEDILNLSPGATGLKTIAGMPDVSSSSYIVMSGSTSEVVLKRHPGRKMSPGKMVMLMTAMVVIDNMYNDAELDNSVEITKKMASYGDDFEEGESIRVGDLLNAMLVGGSTEAAEALASYSATKRKIFVKEMNAKAMELGLMDTHFTNPGGSYNEKQYSTASDLAVIVQAAYRYQLVKKAFEMRSVTTEASVKNSVREVTFSSTNPLTVSRRPSDIYKFSKGGLTGTVGGPVDGSQYAGVAVVDDGMQLIVILLDSNENDIPYEAKGLLQYADTKVTRNVVIEAGEKVGHAKVKGGASTFVPVYTENNGFVYVPPEGSEDLVSSEAIIYDNLQAPLKEGTKVGEYRISVADEVKGTVDLVVKRDVPKGWFPSKIYISNNAVIAIGCVILFILLVFFRIGSVKRRRRLRKLRKREEKIREIALQQMAIDEDRKRRNWNYTTSYDKVAPRTGDLRREAIEAELKRQKELEDAAKASKRKRKAKKKKTIVSSDTPKESGNGSDK